MVKKSLAKKVLVIVMTLLMVVNYGMPLNYAMADETTTPSARKLELTKMIKITDKSGNKITDATLNYDASTETITVFIPVMSEALIPIRIKYQVT